MLKEVPCPEEGELEEEDRKLLHDHAKDRCLIVINKSDLPNQIETADILAIVSREEQEGQRHQVVRISAKNEVGFDRLKETIRSLFFKGNFEPGQAPIVTHLRHKAALAQARESILQAQGIPARQCLFSVWFYYKQLFFFLLLHLLK